MLTRNEKVKTMFQAWRSEENKVWTSEKDKVTMTILKNWEVQEGNGEVQEAKATIGGKVDCPVGPNRKRILY